MCAGSRRQLSLIPTVARPRDRNRWERSHRAGDWRDRVVARLSENSRGPTTSCTSMTRSRFCAGSFRSRELRFGRLPRSCEVPPKRRCHFCTTARNSPTASRRCARPVLKLLAHESARRRDAAFDSPRMSQPRARQECGPVTAGCLGGPRGRHPGTFGFPARSGCGRTASWRLLSASFGLWARRSACSSGHRPGQLCSRRARW